jgi:hypothetical protein
MADSQDDPRTRIPPSGFLWKRPTELDAPFVRGPFLVIVTMRKRHGESVHLVFEKMPEWLLKTLQPRNGVPVSTCIPDDISEGGMLDYFCAACLKTPDCLGAVSGTYAEHASQIARCVSASTPYQEEHQSQRFLVLFVDVYSE